jgi:hypothetical protein
LSIVVIAPTPIEYFGDADLPERKSAIIMIGPIKEQSKVDEASPWQGVPSRVRVIVDF